MANAKNAKTNGNRKTLYLVAYIFMIVGTVCSSWMLIPMAWMIPMTLRTKKAWKQAETNEEISHVALGVCEILFSGLIAGILTTVASALFQNNVD